MFNNISFAELVAGILLIVITIGVLVVVIFYPDRSVPTTLWAFYTSIAGYLFGTQAPSATQRALQERQMNALEALARVVPVS